MGVKNRSHLMRQRKFPARLRPQHGQHGGQRIGVHALGMADADAGQRVRYRPASARIQRVRIALTGMAEHMPVVARSCHRTIAQRQHQGFSR